MAPRNPARARLRAARPIAAKNQTAHLSTTQKFRMNRSIMQATFGPGGSIRVNALAGIVDFFQVPVSLVKRRSAKFLAANKGRK